MKKLLTFLTLLTLFFTTAWAEEVTFATTTVNFTNGAETTSKTIDGITLTFAKGTGTTAVYASSSMVRSYPGNTISVDGGTNTITKITMSFTADNYVLAANECGVSSGNYSVSGTTGTWTGNANSVTLTNNKTSSQARITSVTVTYEVTTSAPDAPTAAVLFSEEDGSDLYPGSTVTLSLDGTASGIKYTTDNTDPKANGTEGTSVTLNGSVGDVITVNAVAFNRNSYGITYGGTVYSATYTLVKPHSTVYRRINNVNDLEVGAKYIILHSPGDESINSNVLAKGTMTNNTRPNVVKEINTTDYSVSVLPTEDIAEFTLGGGENAYTFLCNGKYLSSAASSYLNINGDGTEDDSQWVITFTENQAYIKAKGQTDTKYISWYNNNKCFNVYQYTNTIYLYKEFQEKAYDVTVTQPEEGGEISASPRGTKVVNAGDKITVTATPATGYELTGWTITGANETEPDANNQITATGDVTITATFSKVDYALTRSSNDLSMGDVKITDADGNILDPQPAAAQAGDVVYFKLTTNYGYQPTSNPVTVTNTTSSTTITVAGPDDESGVYSFTMPAGNVNIAATFQSYHGTLRLAGHFNGNTTWRTGNSGPAFTYDNNSDTYTIDAYFTGIDDNGYNDFFFLTLDGEAKHPKADNGNYYISNLDGGAMPFELSGGDSNNFGCAPGVYHIEINGALTSMKFTKQALNISFDPVAGEVLAETNVKVSSNLTTLIDNIKTNDSDAGGTVTMQVSTDGNTYTDGNSVTINEATTVYGKAYIGNIVTEPASAAYTIKEVSLSDIFELVTDATTLTAGDEVIIANSATVGDTKVMGPSSSNGNNRQYSEEEISDGYKIVLKENSTAQVIVLESTEATVGDQTVDAWMLKVGDDQYLYAGSSSSNYLKTGSANNAGENGKATIVVNSPDHDADIIFRGSNTRNTIRWNNGNDMFSCYSSGQSDIFLYKRAAPSNNSAKPTISPQTANIKGGLVNVTLSAKEGAAIYYTTNGDTPDPENPDHLYGGEAFPVTGTYNQEVTVKAIAVEDGKEPSAVASFTYTFRAPSQPVINPSATTSSSDITVVINNPNNAGNVYYVINPSTTPETAEDIVNSTDKITYTEEFTLTGIGEYVIYAAVELNGLCSMSNKTCEITEPAPEGEWKLVQNDDDIKVGREYIVVIQNLKNGAQYTGESYALSTDVYNNNYLSAVNDVVLGENNLTATPGNSVAVITLEGEAGAWMLKTDAGYLYNIGYNNNKNYLGVISNPTDGTGVFSISIGAGDLATIIENVDNRGLYCHPFKNGDIYHPYFALYVNEQPNKPCLYYREAEPTVPEVTLAWLCENGEETTKSYKITDDLQVAYVDVENNVLWVKDADGQSIWSTSPAEDDDNFPIAIQGNTRPNQAEYDQSNWLEVHLSSTSADAMTFKDKVIKGNAIEGTFSNKLNPTITDVTLTADDIDTESTLSAYAPNYYMAANFFGSQNCGSSMAGEDGHGHFFFMNPKPQEFAHVVWAFYSGNNTMTMPTEHNTHEFQGTFKIDMSMNEGLSELDEGTGYNDFQAIIRLKKTTSTMLKDSKPEGTEYIVYPLNITNQTPTAINTVEAGNGDVKGVKYVNVAGMVSDRPFQGVNIVVTEYTDGTSTTSKMFVK